jgi:hypothetical protein
MPLTVTGNTVAECLRTDCNILGDDNDDDDDDDDNNNNNNNKEMYIRPTRYLCFCIYLRTNSDLCHLQHKLIGFYN